MKENIIFILLFSVFYSGMVLLTAPWLVSWGVPRNLLFQFHFVVTCYPFDWAKSLGLIPLNGICWGILWKLGLRTVHHLRPFFSLKP